MEPKDRTKAAFKPPTFLKRPANRDLGFGDGSPAFKRARDASASPGEDEDDFDDGDGEDHGHARLVKRSEWQTPARQHAPARTASGGPSSSAASAAGSPGLRTPYSTSRPHLGTAQTTPGTSSSPSVTTTGGGADTSYYLCMWRKPQAKKHKTWDGDAILIVVQGSERCTLRCADTFKDLVKGAKFNYGQLSAGDELSVGGRDVEIDRQISERAYQAGRPFSEPFASSSTRKKVLAPGSIPNRLSSRPSLESPSTTTKAFRAPAPAKRSTSSSAAASTFYAKPAPRAQPSTPDDSPTKSSRKAGPSGLVNPGSGKKPHPRHDPDAEGAVVMKRPDEWHQSTFNKRGHPVVDVVVDPVLSKHLRPHQIEGVKFLYNKVMGFDLAEEGGGQGAILADEMGLGKTLQTITLVYTLLRQSCYYTPHSQAVERAMIVCPLSLVKNWKREFRKWLGPNALSVLYVDGSEHNKAQSFLHSKTFQVLVIGYEKLRTCAKLLGEAQPPIGLIVCDEGHRLKSKDAKTTKMFEAFSTPRRIILSGTPMQNDLSEFYAMVSFVCPNLLMDYTAFKTVFEDPILKSRMQHCGREARRLGRDRSGILQNITSKVILRRTADLLADYLPPQCEQVVFCSPSPLQIKLYQAVLRSGQAREAVRGRGGSVLTLIGLLRKLCNSPELLLPDIVDLGAFASSKEVDKASRQLLKGLVGFFPTTQPSSDPAWSGKLLALSRLLKAIKRETDDKVVIVSNYTATLDMLETFCRKARYSFERLDGSTKQDSRMDIVNNFNRQDSRRSFIFLLSTKAGGVGLNLVGANRLVLFDSDWNPSTDRQAIARIHRDGQKKRCFIYRMLLAGTMDEKIYQRQISKIGLSDALIDSDKSASKASDAFTPEELKDIFTLHLDSPCVSHDQLACSCGGEGDIGAGAPLTPDSGVKGLDDEDEDEDEDDEELGGFITATQQKATSEAADVKDKRARLASLHRWAHFDCSRVARGEAPEKLNDDMLKLVLKEQAAYGVEAATSTVEVVQPKKVDEVQQGRDGSPKKNDDASTSEGAARPKTSSLLEKLNLDALEAQIRLDERRAEAEKRRAAAEERTRKKAEKAAVKGRKGVLIQDLSQEEIDEIEREEEEGGEKTGTREESVTSPSASPELASRDEGGGKDRRSRQSSSSSADVDADEERDEDALPADEARFDIRRMEPGSIVFVLEKMSAKPQGVEDAEEDGGGEAGDEGDEGAMVGESSGGKGKGKGRAVAEREVGEEDEDEDEGMED